jgi:uncharacterized protein YjbI with pentapeptide repeats
MEFALLAKTALRGANLHAADLSGALLDGAVLSRADLRGTEGLTQAQIDRAYCNSRTRLPEGLEGRR